MELAKQECKPLEIGKLSNAINGERLKNTPENDLKQVLRAIMAMVGVRAANLPDDDEKGLLLAHIVSNYGNHTLEEIKLAFNMAITGKLNCKVDCYENFSCAYFSQIMNAYRNWAKEEVKQFKPVVMIEEKKELTDQEKVEWIKEWVSKENIDMELIPLIFYDYLDGKKLLGITAKEKYEYFDKAALQVKTILHNDIGVCKTNDAYISYQKFEIMEKEGFTGEMKTRILNRAKRLIVFDYLKKSNERNNDIISD